MATLPAPPTNPAEAFGAGDPRNAKYFENLAALEHAYNTTLADDKETLSNDQTNAQYQQSLLTKAEPVAYRNNQHKANAGGILESGVNAERRGTIATQYAQKRYTVQHGLQEDEGKVRKNEEAEQYKYESGRGKAANEALSEGYKNLLETQPNETPQPSGSGVVPKVSTQPGAGYVKVGQPQLPQRQEVRKAAAKKAVS
jgi:hypothetical protein